MIITKHTSIMTLLSVHFMIYYTSVVDWPRPKAADYDLVFIREIADRKGAVEEWNQRDADRALSCARSFCLKMGKLTKQMIL